MDFDHVWLDAFFPLHMLIDIGTTDIGVHALQYGDGRKLYLIDTPGFDDTTRSDTDVLKEISYFLGAAYSKHVKLAGIVYLHSITDTRMGFSALKNLKMFRALCGNTSLEHVVLATTKWDDLLKEETGRAREKELEATPEFWGDMLENGSHMFRHENNRRSAVRIINHLLRVRGEMVLDIQRQMIDQGRSLDQTSAGRELEREVEKVRLKLEKELEEARENLDVAVRSGNQKLRETAARMERESAERVQKAERDRAEMQAKMKADYAKLKAESEAKYKETIDSLNDALQKYKDMVDNQNEKVERLEKETATLKEEIEKAGDVSQNGSGQWQLDAARWQAQHDLEKRKQDQLEEERKARNAALAGKAKVIRTLSIIQAVAGLGMVGVGVCTANPILVGGGASFLGQATHNAASPL